MQPQAVAPKTLLWDFYILAPIYARTILALYNSWPILKAKFCTRFDRRDRTEGSMASLSFVAMYLYRMSKETQLSAPTAPKTDDRRTATQYAILEVFAESDEPQLLLSDIHDRLVLRSDLAYASSEWDDETRERHDIQRCLQRLHNSGHVDCNGRGTPWRLTPKGRAAFEAIETLLS